MNITAMEEAMSNWHPRPKRKDEVKHHSIPVPKSAPTPIPAKIVIVATGETHSTYESRSAAGRVLKSLIKRLPAGAPHTYEIEDDI